MKGKSAIAAAALCATAAVAAALAAENAAENKEQTSKTSEASVVTNENGSVSRSFTECNVTTNGNMVTERRRETRTTLDTAGNVLETSTSEYAQSYTVGDDVASLKSFASATAGTKQDATASDSFLGLKFGDAFESAEFIDDPDEPALKRAAFEPKKPLDGFDDYFVYVTPKTHKVAKVCACAKNAVEPGARWRRHYLVEALEQKYSTYARLCSIMRPLYAFDIGSGRYVTACLAGASPDYGTVVAAWDDAMLTLAADETEELRRAARASAREKRQKRVRDAADAF